MQRCPLTVSNRNPLAYTLEIFQGDTQALCLSGGNDAFGDCVVHPCPKAALFAPPLLQQTFSSASALGLQLGPQAPVAVTQAAQLCATVETAATVNGDIDHTKVHTQVVICLVQSGFSNTTCDIQIPTAVAVNQVSLTLARLQQPAIALVSNTRDELATTGGPDRDACLIPGEDAVIVSDTAVGAETTLGLVVQFIGVSDPCDKAHDQLSRKTELLTSRGVDQLLQLEPVEGPGIPGKLAGKLPHG